MASTQHASCDNCRFFDDHKTNAGSAAADEGLCRFNPPVNQPEPNGHGLWPVVGSNDWCGHFNADVQAGE